MFDVDKCFGTLRPVGYSFSEFKKKYLEERWNKVQREQITWKTWTGDREALNKFEILVGDLRLVDINSTHIDMLVEYMQNNPTRWNTPYSRRSINRYLRHISSAFSYAVKMLYAEKNPCKGYPKLSERGYDRPKYMKPEQVKTLREYYKNKVEWWGDVFNLSLWTGLRMSEIYNINKEDLEVMIINDDMVYFIKVIGKGRKKRPVPLNKKALKLIQRRIEYLDKPEKLFEICDKSFKGSDNKRTQKALQRAKDGYIFWEISDPASISKAFRRARKELGLVGINFHSARHTFGTQYLNAGGNVFILQEIMGHSSVRSTQIYSKGKMESMKRDIDKLPVY